MRPTMLCNALVIVLVAAADGTSIQEWTFNTNYQPSNFSLTVLLQKEGSSRIKCIVDCSQLKGCFTLEYEPSTSSCTMYRLFRDEDGRAAIASSASGAHSLTMDDPRGQHYGETCSCHADCVDDKMQCLGRTCRCVDGYGFNNKDLSCIEERKHHGDLCSSHAECVDDWTQCIDNMCKCLAGYSHNPGDTTCIKERKHHGDLCSSHAECVDDRTQCTDNVCKCLDGYSYNPGDTTCIKDPKDLHYGDICSSHAECADDRTRCTDNVCKCLAGYSFDPGNRSCVKDPKGKRYDERCSGYAECVDDETQCIDHVCKCLAGYSFNPGDRSCVKECDIYGRTFELLSYEYCSKGFNDATHHVSTFKGCSKRCRMCRYFTCRSFEIWRGACYLSKHTKLDVPSRDWKEYDGCRYFQRNCE